MQNGDETIARLARAVATRLPAALNDADLVACLSEMGAAWLLLDPGRVNRDASGRLRLRRDASAKLKQMGRTIVWMKDSRYHHGQQAAEMATKALRGLRTGRLGLDDLLKQSASFRAMRYSHVRRKARDKAHAQPEWVLLYNGAYRATRIVSGRELNRLGQEAGNCLARPTYFRSYADKLRRKVTAFWRIDAVKDAPCRLEGELIWVVAMSIGTGDVEEVQQIGEGSVTLLERDVLLEFLAGGQPGTEAYPDMDALTTYAISLTLINACRESTLSRFRTRLAGAIWRFEVASGVLTAIAESGEVQIGDDGLCALSLHGLTTNAGQVLSVLRGSFGRKDEDWGYEVDDNAARYARGLAVRLAFRAACARSRTLSLACDTAFAAESLDFRADWFGTVDRRRQARSQG